MNKNKHKTSQMKDGLIQVARDISRSIGGKGVEITVGDPETTGIQNYFSSDLPHLEITTFNAKRKVAVEVSSVEQYNETLLHFLFRKTIEKKG